MMDSDTSLRQAAFDACSSGDTSTLLRLFEENGIQPTNGPVRRWFIGSKAPPPPPDYISEFSIPNPYDLLERAVVAKQPAIIKLIFITYPSISLAQMSDIVEAILANPHGPTLQALVDHQPSFASFSVDYGLRSFLTEACSNRSEDIVPVIHVLLDAGGDVNDGWGPGGGAMWRALLADQPFEIIQKIADMGGIISYRCVGTAITQDRPDVFEMLLNHKWNRLDEKHVEKIRGAAQESGDKGMVLIVEEWIEKRRVKERLVEKRRNSWWRRLLS